jgi:hypothetical protein
LAEHLLCKQGVGGSSPLVSTPKNPGGAWVFVISGVGDKWVAGGAVRDPCANEIHR